MCLPLFNQIHKVLIGMNNIVLYRITADSLEMLSCTVNLGVFHLFRCIGFSRCMNKSRHILLCDVGLKYTFSLNPLSAFLGNGLLRHLITELDFKLCTIEILFTVHSWDIKLSFLFLRFFCNKSRSREDKPKFFTLLQFFFLIPDMRKLKNLLQL